MTIIPQCLSCKHLTSQSPMRCAAFPDGIPRAILLLEHDHREPYPGDGGIRYEREQDPPGVRS